MGPTDPLRHQRGFQIAYEVFGSGPVDLVFVHGWVTHLELLWEQPRVAQSLAPRLLLPGHQLRQARDGPVRPGAGRPPADARAAHGRRAGGHGRDRVTARGAVRALRGRADVRAARGDLPPAHEGAHHERRFRDPALGPGYPWAPTPEERQRHVRALYAGWGGMVHLPELAPGVMDDEQFRDWWARFLRSSASPGAAAALTSMSSDSDVRDVLGAIRVPTLVIHRRGDRRADVRGARWMAQQIPGARSVELPGEDHLIWADPDPIFDAVEEFVTGVPTSVVPDRVLVTVVFTDVVGSTEAAAAMGDRSWRRTLDRHDEIVRRCLERYQAAR